MSNDFEFLNVLFGDRPALTNVESFYQRALAGDVDEVQENAEDLLKERSLASYYDDVAMPGLELAAHDLARGLLTRGQMERIKDTVITLVAELEEHEDETSKPSGDPQMEANESASTRKYLTRPLLPSDQTRLGASGMRQSASHISIWLSERSRPLSVDLCRRVTTGRNGEDGRS
jgi:hypothetical protein